MIHQDRRLKTAAEPFAGGRLPHASDLARTLWAEGDRSPELAVLCGELALLGYRIAEAEAALRLAREALMGPPRLTGLLAETLRRAGRLAEAAELYLPLGRVALAQKLARLAPGGWYRLSGEAAEVPWLPDSEPPLAEALADGVPVRMILDTGMSGAALALPASTARLAGVDLDLARDGVGYGVGQALEAQPIRCRSLTAAGATRWDLLGMVIDRFKLERRFGLRIGGLVGDGFVHGACLELDFPRGRVRLSAPAEV